jgi:hypothetical protein
MGINIYTWKSDPEFKMKEGDREAISSEDILKILRDTGWIKDSFSDYEMVKAREKKQTQKEIK